MATNFIVYNAAIESMSDGTFDMDNATANVWGAVLLTTAYGFDNTHVTFADVNVANVVTNALSNVKPLVNTFWNRNAGVVTFGADAITWTANGGTMSPCFVVVYQDADLDGGGPPANADKLLGWANIDPQSVSNAGTFTLRDGTNNSQIVMFTVQRG